MPLSRRARRTNDFDIVDAALPRHVVGWAAMDTARRTRLVEVARAYAQRWTWEGSRNFTVTDEIRTVIAANAALMTIGWNDPLSAFSNVRAVVVHPSTVRTRGTRSGPADGVVSDESVALAGEAHHHHGPLVLSWGSVRRETRQFGTGYNVVIHEFAHKLDMGDGVVDGMPPIADRSLRERWQQVCAAEFAILSAGTSPHVLRDYAATDRGEFFAVAAEAYFDQPHLLVAHHRHLYAVLDDYFRPS